MGRRVGIRDVAAEARVSTATVSSVLNGKQLDRISAETQRRVRAVAEQLGYQPNSLARALRTSETAIIGMISDLVATTPYAGALIQGAQAAAAEAGYVLMLVNAERDPATERAGIEALLRYQIQGLVHAGITQRVLPNPLVPDMELPVVFANQLDDAERYPSVVADERAGARSAVGALVEAGHRRVGYVGHDSGLLGPRLRREGFLDAARQGLIEVSPGGVVDAEDFTAPAARAAATELLTRLGERPSAVFAATDQIAAGVYQAAFRLGLRIPHDLSVVGYGNWRLLAAELDPPLTTVAIPYSEIGQQAVRQLLAGAAGGVVLVATTLIRRGSIAPPA